MEKVMEKYMKKLFRYPNVRSVGLGYKEIKGEKTPDEEKAICVGVTQKTPLVYLRAADVIPSVLDDVVTDVRQVGHVQIHGNTGRYRPPKFGVSGGNALITAGTLGCEVQMGSQTMMLSNAHVFAPDATKEPPPDEYAILQPGTYDGGTVENDVIASLLKYIRVKPTMSLSECPVSTGTAKLINLIPRALRRQTRMFAYAEETELNLVDAAIATPFEEVDREILHIGEPVGSIEGAILDLPVMKSGRTTELTHGIVDQVMVTVNVGYGYDKFAMFTDQIIIKGKDVQFSSGGDSGSAIIYNHDGELKVCGLLFAGSEATAGQESITIANRIQNVMDLLAVKVPN